MGIKKRLEDTIDEKETGWAAKWADRLKDWLGAVLSFGIDVFMRVLGTSFAPKLAPIVKELEATGEVPPVLQPLLNEIKEPTGEAGGMLASALGYSLVGTALGRMSEALFGTMGQELAKLHPTLIPSVAQLVIGYLRGEVTPADFKEAMLRNGWQEWYHEWFLKLAEARLDPDTITRIWLRDKETNEKWWTDLEHQGWDKDRIDVVKELAHIIPPLADMVRFADFGSFDPKIIELWREFYDAPGWITEPMALLGITGEWANKYWFSHWRQPGRYELGELHRRGLIDDDLVKNAYLTQGYSSFWQDKLLELVKEPWTRVDVRRMWDMRTIDEEQLRKAYRAVGYYDEQLEGMVLWTKVYVAFPDLVARWKNGWITLDDVRAQLTGLGMPSARVEELIETKVKTAQPERIAGERELTKSDIYKGIKADRITRAQGVDLLMDLGFDEDEADILLDTNVPEDVTDKVVAQRELTKADILKGLKTEVITREEAGTRLLELRYSPADAEFLLKIFDAQVKPPEEPAEREASKADIVAAVKKDLITPEDAYLMLQDIDFTPEASQFILSVRAEVSAFSPINYPEFKERTQKYRVAAGMEVKPMPEELKKAAEEVVQITGEVEALQRSLEEEERGLVDEEILPAAATARRDELRVSLHRAEAELARVKSDYASKLAEWRHGTTE